MTQKELVEYLDTVPHELRVKKSEVQHAIDEARVFLEQVKELVSYQSWKEGLDNIQAQLEQLDDDKWEQLDGLERQAVEIKLQIVRSKN